MIFVRRVGLIERGCDKGSEGSTAFNFKAPICEIIEQLHLIHIHKILMG